MDYETQVSVPELKGYRITQLPSPQGTSGEERTGDEWLVIIR